MGGGAGEESKGKVEGIWVVRGYLGAIYGRNRGRERKHEGGRRTKKGGGGGEAGKEARECGGGGEGLIEVCE